MKMKMNIEELVNIMATDEGKEEESETEYGAHNLLYIGTEIAQMHYNIMTSNVIDWEMFLFMMKYLGDFPLRIADGDKPKNMRAQIADLIVDLEDWYSTGATTVEAIQEKYLKDPLIVAELKKEYLLGFLKEKDKFDPIVRASIMAWTRPKYMPFKFYSDAFWLQWMTSGNNGVITGKKGSGKTDFAVMLCEIAYRNNWEILTNVKIQDERFEKSYATTFSELMHGVINNAIKALDDKEAGKPPRQTLILLDEMKVGGVRKKRAMSGISLNLDEFDALTRKFGADVLFIWHRDTEIPTEIYSDMSFLGHKLGSTDYISGRKTGDFKFWAGRSLTHYYINSIPGTTLNYETRDIAPFITDISLSLILQETIELNKEIENPRDLYRAIRDFIESFKDKNKEPETKQDQKKELKKK